VDWAGERASRARGRVGKRLAGLGSAGREEKEKAEPAGLCERRQRGGKRPSWAGPQGRKERGKKKRASGPGPIRKEGEKDLHSNAFEFEFEI
jgi:hypothetical protein